MADIPYGAADEPRTGSVAGPVVNLIGAGLSLALVAGIGVWGYKLVMRDVTGVPVVKAMEGPMRIQPENPGGEVALHRGLSVNTIAAEGEAAPPEDRLVLAPEGVDLAAEDMEVAPAADETGGEAVTRVSAMIAEAAAESDVSEAEVQEEVAAAGQEADGPLTAEQILALADEIARGTQPLEPVEEGATTGEVELALDGSPVVDVIPASVPGVSRSLRPKTRPMRITAIEPTSTMAAPASETRSLDPSEITVGTKLVQLGAFDSEQVALAEWQALQGRFGEFMGDKARVIQRAESGGRTFWRLRAAGFGDLSEARRFCAALVAEDALCIPVVVR
ncbi:SPOR domain-containing protein [Histidinibacterium aquaticum]|uniref:SPOR domain-containing protein n=1 Tax=Histidinibacterium aquaticum TaxID=2613962 RepID=A0A5J5GKU4_9RHOB|nr:SPOR domain-containing protein [Histidinibacterium aquaticum]KAA9008919.1 SPOR domain-containing protein [Histidinibacterium aquaticum]